MRPKSVQVGPHVYTITYEKGLVSATDGSSGATGADTQSILVDDQLGSTVERETVLHEVLHAVWTQTLLDLTLDDNQEEQVIWSLSPRLLDVIRSNRSLIYWLMSDDQEYN